MYLLMTLQFLATLILVAFWMRDRSRLRLELERVCQRQTAAESHLLRFISESEATFLEVSRHLDEASKRTSGSPARKEQSTASPRISLVEQSRVSSETAVEPTSPQVSDRQGKRERVMELAAKGASPAEISSQLMLPRGEIDLVLRLRRKAAKR